VSLDLVESRKRPDLKGGMLLSLPMPRWRLISSFTYRRICKHPSNHRWIARLGNSPVFLICKEAYLPGMMDLRRAVNDFVSQGRDVLQRLRSSERVLLSDIDLHMLRVQLHLLVNETINIQTIKLLQKDRELSKNETSQ